MPFLPKLRELPLKKGRGCAILWGMNDDPTQQMQDRWWQILPMDVELRHEIAAEGNKRRPAIIVTPREALERVAKAFRETFREPGVLVDADHASERPEGSTRACGWVKAVELRPDGLYAKIHFTPYGLGLVGGGEYVNRSPAFEVVDLGGGRYEPARLTSLALTNTPAFETLNVACCSVVQRPKPKDHQMDPKAIAQLLGLPEEATPEEITAALNERLTRLKDLEAAEADRAEAQAKAEEEAFMEENKDAIREEDKEEVRAQFRANPETTRRLFAAFRRAAPKPAAGRTLGADAKAPTVAASRLPAAKAAERDRFVAEVKAQLSCSCSMAWNEARARRPDLFV